MFGYLDAAILADPDPARPASEPASAPARPIANVSVSGSNRHSTLRPVQLLIAPTRTRLAVA